MSTTLTCFKYRSPAAALRCLAEGSLYFAKPSELNDTLEAKYYHATPEDFSRVMAQTFTEISQQRGGPALDFDQRGRADMAEAHARECERLQDFTDQIGIFSAAQRPDPQAMWDLGAGCCSGRRACAALRVLFGAWRHLRGWRLASHATSTVRGLVSLRRIVLPNQLPQWSHT